MPLRDVSPSDLLSHLGSSDTPVAALLWSPDDAPSIHVRESLEELVALPDVTIEAMAIDVSAHPDAADHWPLPDVPTVLFLRGSAQKGIHEGPVSCDELKRLVTRAFPDVTTRGRRRRRSRPEARRTPVTAAARGRDGAGMLPTPRQMRDHLDRFIRGQDRAKRDVAAAIYNHYLAQADRDAHGGEPRPHHILLLGPTGCGKTFIVRTVADVLGVPVAVTSATGLVEAGYRGRSPDSLVKALLDRAGGDARLAEKGIVFIDEIDKIRCQDCGGGRDVSGEGVQNALLTLIGGITADNVDGHAHSPVDTSKILFVCTGAFVGLPDIVRRRLGSGRSSIGFRSSEAERAADIPDQPIYEALCQVQTADLVEYGLIPEFIGRFTTVTALHELGLADLRRIIDDGTEESAIAHVRRLAAIHGIDLEFDDGALDAIAQEAQGLGLGARGLKRLINRAMEGVGDSWVELADAGVTRVVVDRDVVLSGREPRRRKGKRRIPRHDRFLRSTCLRKTPGRGDASGQSIAEMSEDEGRRWLEHLAERQLGWAQASGSEKLWWQGMVSRTTLAHAHWIVEELRRRYASISEAFSAHVKAGTDDVDAILHFLDYLRARTRDDAEKKRRGRDPLDDLLDDVPF